MTQEELGILFSNIDILLQYMHGLLDDMRAHKGVDLENKIGSVFFDFLFFVFCLFLLLFLLLFLFVFSGFLIYFVIFILLLFLNWIVPFVVFC